MPISMAELENGEVKFTIRDKAINGELDPDPYEVVLSGEQAGSLPLVTLAELANPQESESEQIWYETFMAGGVKVAFRYVQDLGYSIFENLYGNHTIDGPYKVEE